MIFKICFLKAEYERVEVIYDSVYVNGSFKKSVYVPLNNVSHGNLLLVEIRRFYCLELGGRA